MGWNPNSNRDFSQGADSRLRGEPESVNPGSIMWALGWKEVDKHYAEEVHGRWTFDPLPEVKRKV